MPEQRAPSVRGRLLARELRRLRGAAGLTGEAVAAQLGWSSAKVSRIETAISPVTIPDLRKLLALYGSTDAEAQRLEDLARTSRERGWWDLYTEALIPEYATYIGLEAEATSLKCYDALLVHGLLQTEEYARAVISRAGIQVFPGDIERRVQVRRLRQQRLLETCDSSLEFCAVLDETVLRRQVGGPDIMRNQLGHIADIAALPNVTLQVLAFSAGVPPASDGSFTILSFSHVMPSDTVYVDLIDSAVYIENERDVYRYTLAFNELRARALDPDDSLDFIKRAVLSG